jgi:hypothetical protein
MKTFTLLLVSLISTCSYCQDSSYVKCPIGIQALVQYDFPQSYGIAAGVVYELTPLQRKINYSNSFDYHLWICTIEAGWLHYPLNSSAINARAGIGVRISKYPSHYHEWLMEEGILRTFYQGTVYTVSADGNVKEISGYGRTYGTTGISYLQNWDINLSHNYPVSIIIKPSLWIQYPFNGFIKAHTSLDIGARFSFIHKKSSIHAS